MLKVVVLVSGGGTNLQALIDAMEAGMLKGVSIVGVISSKKDAYALERAKKHGIFTETIQKSDYEGADGYEAALASAIREKDAGLVVLAGFMTILSKRFIDMFPNKIINVHPSLIPSFCGDGFYGMKVHEAAIARGVKLSGATVHYVNHITDGGPIILQKAVPVLDSDTPESLQKRVMEQAEHILLPEAVSMIANEEIEKIEVLGGVIKRRGR